MSKVYTAIELNERNVLTLKVTYKRTDTSELPFLRNVQQLFNMQTIENPPRRGKSCER